MPSQDIWTGGSGDWDVGSNWSNGTSPGALDAAVFDDAITADLTSADYEQIASLSMATGGATLQIEGVLDIGDAHLNGVANVMDTSQGTLLIDGGGLIAGQFITSAVGSIALSAGGTYQWNGSGSTQTIDMGDDANDTFQFSTAFGGTISNFVAGDIISYSGAVNSVVIGDDAATFHASNGQTYVIDFADSYYNSTNLIVDDNVLQSTIQLDTWIAGDGDGSDGADWSAGVPTSASTVLIGALEDANVTLGASTAIAGLDINATDQLTVSAGAILTVSQFGLVAAGATLSLAGGATFSDGLEIGGAVTGGGILAIAGGNATLDSDGQLTAANWSISGAATLFTLDASLAYAGAFSEKSGATLALANGNLTLTGTAAFSSGATVNGGYALKTAGSGATVGGLTIGGTVAWSNAKTVNQSGGNVTIGDGSGAVAIIRNLSTGAWNITDDSWIVHGLSASSLFSNAGLFEKTGGAGTSAIATSFTNFGGSTVSANAGTLAFKGPSNSFAGTIGGTGTVLFAAGTTTLNVGTTISVANLKESGASTVVSVLGSVTDAKAFGQGAGSTLSVAGGHTLTLQGATTLSGNVTGPGTLALGGGGAASVSGGAAFSVANWINTGAGTAVTLSQSLTYAGAFSDVAGATVTLSGGALNLTGSAKFNSATLNGSTTLNTSGTGATVGGLTIGGTVTWTNTGAVSEGGGNVTIGDSAGDVAVVHNNGFWNLTGDNGIGHGGSASSHITDAGTFQKVGGTGTSLIAASFAESATGTVSADSGTLDFTGPSNSFAGAITGAGTIAFGGGSSKLQSGASFNAGDISELGHGTLLAIAEDLTYSGSFNQGAGAKLSVAADDTMLFEGGTTLNGSVSGAGTLAFESDTAVIGSGATLSVATWLMKGAGSSTTLDENLGYAGGLIESQGAFLTLAGGDLHLTGAAGFGDATVNGSHALYTSGAQTTVQGLTIGGTVVWTNTKTVTEDAADVTIGDNSGGKAAIFNTTSGVWNIIDDSGIALGSATSHITNAGLFEKTGGDATSIISPAFANSGTISAGADTLDFTGAVTGTGADNIASAAVLEFDATVSAGQTVSFLGDNAELTLGNPQGFAGKINGFDVGVANDTIEIAAPWTYAGFTENLANTQGTLAFTNGSTQIGITLLGDYAAANFNAQVLNSGNTLITYG